MEDIHPIFSEFKREFPELHRRCEELGQEVHDGAGPLPEGVRCLLKVAIAAASRHERALETQLARARAAGVSAEELRHALALLIPTCGFPTFMEAYAAYRRGS